MCHHLYHQYMERTHEQTLQELCSDQQQSLEHTKWEKFRSWMDTGSGYWCLLWDWGWCYRPPLVRIRCMLMFCCCCCLESWCRVEVLCLMRMLHHSLPCDSKKVEFGMELLIEQNFCMLWPLCGLTRPFTEEIEMRIASHRGTESFKTRTFPTHHSQSV